MRTTLIVSLLIVAVCAMMFGDALVEADEYEYHGPGWEWSDNPPGTYDPPPPPDFGFFDWFDDFFGAAWD